MGHLPDPLHSARRHSRPMLRATSVKRAHGARGIAASVPIRRCYARAGNPHAQADAHEQQHTPTRLTLGIERNQASKTELARDSRGQRRSSEGLHMSAYGMVKWRVRYKIREQNPMISVGGARNYSALAESIFSLSGLSATQQPFAVFRAKALLQKKD
jgi:hypothetical protein